MDFIGGMLGFGNDPSAKLKEFDDAKANYGSDYQSDINSIENERKIYDDAKAYLNGDDAGSYKQKLANLAAEKTAKQSEMENAAKSIIAKVSELSDKAGRAAKTKQDEENLVKITAKKNIANKISNIVKDLRTTAQSEKEAVKNMLKNRPGAGWTLPKSYEPYGKAYDDIDRCVNNIESLVKDISGKVTLEKATILVNKILEQASLLVGVVLDESNYESILSGYANAGEGLYKQFKSKEEYARTGQAKEPDANFDMKRVTSDSVVVAATGGDGSVTFSYTFLIIAVVLILIMLFLHFHLKRSRMPYTKVVEYC